MHVEEIFGAGNPSGLAGVRGDEPVEALSEVSDGDRMSRGPTTNGEVELDQSGPAIPGIRMRLPTRAWVPRENRPGIPRGDGFKCPTTADGKG
jgi:hypothetical protein